jgi:multidrug resistance efflux pump
MRTPFAKSQAFLDSEERSRVGRIVAAAAVLLCAWAAWLAFSKTTVFAVSDEGRLLAAGAASPIQTPVAGVVAESHLKLGAEVTAGEVLLALDSSAERLRRDEEQSRRDGMLEAIQSLEQIIEAERGLAGATARAGATRVSSAAAKTRAAANVAALAKQQDDAIRRLQEASLVSGVDALKAAEELQRQRGQVTVNNAETALAAADNERTRKETDVRLLTLHKELIELKARATSSSAVIATLDWEVARRKLRAPVDGVVADLVAMPVGAAVSPNQTVATVVPRTRMRWVAYFPMREAVGRIRSGQRARIRLDAFPWTAYGPLTANVVGVGSEPHEQRVRVELELTGENASIPLSHGMTGITDVEIEQLTPFRLLLRLSGQTVQGRGQAPSRGKGDSAFEAPRSPPP